METAHENRNIALIILAVMITLTALSLGCGKAARRSWH